MNKEKSFRGIILLLFMNWHSQEYNSFIYQPYKFTDIFVYGMGDKDYFHIIWKILDLEYLFMPLPMLYNAFKEHCGVAMIQVDQNNRPLFFHHTAIKFSDVPRAIEIFEQL